MKVVLPGGSGQVGTLLARSFGAEGHEVVMLSRSPGSAAGGSSSQRPWRVLPWDARTLGPWTEEIDGANVVVNLAGRSVDCRYDERNRKRIVDSRVDSTRVVGEAIARARRPPKVWLQMSTATIYAHRYDAPNDEATTRWMLEIGAFFLRTETELVLKSRRVVPGRLTASGFAFDFPTWPEAARDLCERYRQASA